MFNPLVVINNYNYVFIAVTVFYMYCLIILLSRSKIPADNGNPDNVTPGNVALDSGTTDNVSPHENAAHRS